MYSSPRHSCFTKPTIAFAGVHALAAANYLCIRKLKFILLV